MLPINKGIGQTLSHHDVSNILCNFIPRPHPFLSFFTSVHGEGRREYESMQTKLACSWYSLYFGVLRFGGRPLGR